MNKKESSNASKKESSNGSNTNWAPEEQIVNVYVAIGQSSEVSQKDSVTRTHVVNRTVVHLRGNRLYELRQRPLEVQGQTIQELFWFKLPDFPQE